MLKLRHILDITQLAIYNQYINTWLLTLRSYKLGSDYVIPLPSGTIRVKKGSRLCKILNTIAKWNVQDFYKDVDDLKRLIPNFERANNDLLLLAQHPKKNGGTETAKVLKFLFITNGYDSHTFDKARGIIFDDAPIATCPYCNRHYIKTIIASKSVVRGQLDHFYAKDRYPYLALHLYNLVPACYNCNHGKSNNNTNLVSPYELQTSDGLHFFAHIKNSSIFSLSSFENGIDIDVDVQSNAPANLSNNITAFHLREIYATHKDFVAELYVKSKLKMNQAYARSIMRYYKGRSFRLTASDQKRLITGVYTDEKDYGKRPLSKFCTDIAKQFELI